MHLALFIALTLLAEILGTLGGFGSSALFVPLCGFFFGFQTVLAFTGILHVFSNGAKLWLFGKHLNLRIFFWLGIPSLIFSVIGAFLIVGTNSEWSQIILGIFLVSGSSLLMLWPSIQMRDKSSNHLIAGSTAGFLAGFTGTGGPVRALALSAVGLSKESFIASSAAIDMAVDLPRSVIYLSAGYLDPELYWYIPILAGIAFLGLWLGKLLLDRVTSGFFRSLVLLLVFAIGSMMIIKTIFYDT